MFRRFMDTLSEHFFTILFLGLATSCAVHEVYGCARQQACEDGGGTVVDRNKSSWRCVKPGQAEASKAAP